MSTVHERVRAHVLSNPGVHFNELARDLDIATGQAQYHLRTLVATGVVTAETIRGRTHYFDPSFDGWERRLCSLGRRPTTRAILLQLLQADQVAAGDLAERLDLARSTVAWNVASLVEAGIVEKSYGPNRRVELSLTRPAETRRLLRVVDPPDSTHGPPDSSVP